VKLVAAEVCFHPDDENHCATVGFRATDNAYLLLTRSLEPDEQDRRLRLDGVHVELTDQGYSCYDGIGAVTLFPAMIRFDLNENGRRNLQQDHVEVVVHDLPPERLLQMRQVLALVFDGFPRYIDCA
jgi:hypothetical protein